MAKRTDKPTSFTEQLQRAIPGVTPEMKDALAKMVSPEMKEAFRKIAERFQGDEQDPPATEPEAPTSEPSPEA